MEFVDLAWIALIVFYFLLRSVGGSKGKRPTRSPQPAGRSGQAGSDDELDSALDEIRRALGFPDQAAEDAGEREAAEPVREPRPAQRQSPTRTGDRPRVSKPARHRPEPRPRTRPAARRRSASDPVAGLPGGSQPAVGDAIVPDLPSLRSSFAEEEAFEKVGRHPHRTTRHDLRVANPYESPQKKKLPGVLRTLGRRSSLREAFLLKEILDRPVSMRRR